MTASAIIVDGATGAIKRKITGDPAMFGIQAATGETAFALIDDDGQRIDDANLFITEQGAWSAKEGAPEGVVVPDLALGLIV